MAPVPTTAWIPLVAVGTGGGPVISEGLGGDSAERVASRLIDDVVQVPSLAHYHSRGLWVRTSWSSWVPGPRIRTG